MGTEFKEDENIEVNNQLVNLLKSIPVRDLITEAMEAREMSYAPYSKYNVGASLLLSDQSSVQGCNIENAAFGPTVCAERTAIFSAVSKGCKSFKAIAIVGSPSGRIISQYSYPCGVCRQVMMEFCNPDTFVVIVARSVNDYKVFLLKELLPEGFGPGNLAE